MEQPTNINDFSGNLKSNRSYTIDKVTWFISLFATLNGIEHLLLLLLYTYKSANLLPILSVLTTTPPTPPNVYNIGVPLGIIFTKARIIYFFFGSNRIGRNGTERTDFFLFGMGGLCANRHCPMSVLSSPTTTKMVSMLSDEGLTSIEH
ncbi:hypothetical protein BLOT_002291 [Blomia tropicalis]|nr:hypothetical protein BLOT_002291 [Blomia tropicalis]